MEAKPDTSRILMSEVLKGQVPELGDSNFAEIAAGMVTVVADRIVGQQSVPLVGIMHSVLFDAQPEIEFRVALSEAFDIVEATDLHFNDIDMHHGTRIIKLRGPFQVSAARIQEIDSSGQVCTLMLSLKRLVGDKLRG